MLSQAKIPVRVETANTDDITIEDENDDEIDMRVKIVISDLSDVTMVDLAEDYTPSPCDGETKYTGYRMRYVTLIRQYNMKNATRRPGI